MKKNNNKERQSAHTPDGVNERNSNNSRTMEENEVKEGQGLCDAASSTTSFWSKVWRYITKADEKERHEAFVRDQDRKVKEIMDWFEKYSLPDSYNRDYGENLKEVDEGFNRLIKYRLKSKNLDPEVSDQKLIDKCIEDTVMDNMFAYGLIPKSYLDEYYSKVEARKQSTPQQ